MTVYGGHVHIDRAVRERKAEKIRRLLSARCDLATASVLDLGAGSGLLSRYLQPHCREVLAADRDTAPFQASGVPITRIDGIELPFDGGRFDVVVYNHVLEHVGERETQRRALDEIHRVLAPGGIVYLATPNRWAIIEPHYRLPLLSWFPQAVADRYVQWSRGASWYDCRPLGRGELLRLLDAAGFRADDVSIEAIREVVAVEWAAGVRRSVVSRAPDAGFRALRAVFPSYVMIGVRREGAAVAG